MILLWVEHVPNGVEGIHFEFVVLVTPCIDIEEHLEVVVVVDHRVTLSDRRPDILLLQARDEIDRLIVPQHRGARQTPGRRRIGRLMILKWIGPGRRLPHRFIEVAIDLKRLDRAVADVGSWQEQTIRMTGGHW